MGGGASTLIRLRKALVMRAYNLRNGAQTFDEQFRQYAYRYVRYKLFLLYHYVDYSTFLYCFICRMEYYI